MSKEERSQGAYCVGNEATILEDPQLETLKRIGQLDVAERFNLREKTYPSQVTLLGKTYHLTNPGQSGDGVYKPEEYEEGTKDYPYFVHVNPFGYVVRALDRNADYWNFPQEESN
ncbi:MAG TPA: hypothetical protein VJJ02_00675 [Candidatus Paceibacterota bacterium]